MVLTLETQSMNHCHSGIFYYYLNKLFFDLFNKFLDYRSNLYMVLPGIALEYIIRKYILKTLKYFFFPNINTASQFPLDKHRS